MPLSEEDLYVKGKPRYFNIEGWEQQERMRWLKLKMAFIN
jgi:hypothetical protein